MEPAPQDVQLWCPPNEVPALGGLLDVAVEAEEQEDVAAADALLGEVALGDAGLAEHSPPLLPVGSVLPVPVSVKVEVGIEVDQVECAHAAVCDAGDNVGDLDVAVLEVFEGGLVAGGYGEREHGAVGKDGAGTASGARIKALATDDQFS